MEKASTPRNRLTRSSAKQVNTPKTKDQEEPERSSSEEIKHNARKTRRKHDTKAKTNGEATNYENRLNSEDPVDGNTGNRYEQEDPILNIKPQDSPTTNSQKTPSPTISRRSLRTRRSSTPGPDLELSASKTLKRSSSLMKLEPVSTPTNRRGRRAQSESKDFVFTPSKDKKNSSHDTNGKYIPNASSRTIEKIDEVSEVEKSSEDERETSNLESEDKMNESAVKVGLVGEGTTDKEIYVSTHSKTEATVNIGLNNSMSQMVKNDGGIPNSSKTSPESLNNDFIGFNDSMSQMVKNDGGIPSSSNTSSESLNNDFSTATEPKEVNDETKVKETKSNLEIGSLSVEVDELPVTKFSENTELPVTVSDSPGKETSQANESSSENNVTELTIESVPKPVQEDEVNNEISERPDFEIQEAEEIDELIPKKSDEVKDPCDSKNIAVDREETNLDETMTFLKETNKQLQSIVDICMEESDDDSRTSCDDNDAKLKTKNETQNLEISNIELINSSDTEDGNVGERHENSVVTNSKENVKSSENEDIKYTIEDKNCENESLKETFESGIEEHASDSVLPEKDLQTIDSDVSDHQDHQYQEQEDFDYESTKKFTHAKNNMEAFSDQPCIDLHEKYMEKEGITALEMTEPCNIVIENPHTIAIEDSVPDNLTSDDQDNDIQDPLLQKKCQDSDQGQNLTDQNKFQEKEMAEGLNVQGTSRQEDMFSDKSEPGINNDEENYNKEHFDENYEDEEVNKSEEGSCDIYKGLSDSGSYVDEREEGSQFNDSVSSEMQSGTGDSGEDYVTSADEEEEDIVEKTRLINEICSGPLGEKAKELLLSKDGEKKSEKNPDSPMTYDKALAIINKNRVKKIDDEEFFDMFTQELNKVSEQSGSDSDIAIVDEYLMEPEEPTKKIQPKSENVQNAKQSSRPTGSAITNRPMPPESYPGGFNQQIHAQPGSVVNQHGHASTAQHNHPAMQRVDFTQGAMYQQFDQNLHLRGQLMYNQYAHPSTSMHNLQMFHNPPVACPSDVNFRNSMFNPSQSHSLGPTSESSIPPNSTSLKIRTVNDMNNLQSVGHNNYRNLDQAPLHVSEERIFESQEDKDNYMNLSPQPVAETRKMDTGSARPNNLDTPKPHESPDKKGNKSRTPILDLLGLDEKALKLLKKCLGINSIKRNLMKLDLEWQKKCLQKTILKNELRQRGRKSETRYRNLKRSRDNNSSSFKSSSDDSSEESTVTSSVFSGESNQLSSSENDNRKVDIEDGSVYITLKTKRKQRHRNRKDFNFKEACRSGETSTGISKQKIKTRIRRKSRSSAEDLKSKKMTKKQPAVVKSQCGTFTVDPLTASSQSSDSEIHSMDDKDQIKELKRKMKHDLASGKNKLSNMFSQSTLKRTKESKKHMTETYQDIKGPLRRENVKELRKLPSEILETLAKEDKRKKRQRTLDSGSDEVERPKKIRKRSQKMKVKTKIGDLNYIPCVTGGATEFGLSRLDKDGTLSLAEKAAKFRTDQLYGSSVKRITILDFKHQWC